MPATQTAATVTDWGQLFLTPGSLQTLAALPNPLGLDLLYISGEGGTPLIKVSSTGVVTKNPATHTTQTLFGRYLSRLKSTATTAQIFADVFSENKSNQDIIQLRGQGGRRIWHLDFQGISFNS